MQIFLNFTYCSVWFYSWYFVEGSETAVFTKPIGKYLVIKILCYLNVNNISSKRTQPEMYFVTHIAHMDVEEITLSVW